MKLDTLYKRDKTGKKILTCEIEVDGTDKDIDTGRELTLFSTVAYNVIRTTGFIDGKKQKHVDLVTDGKQTRTVFEQAVLEAKSHFNSKKDEGYKTLEDLGIVVNESGHVNCGDGVVRYFNEAILLRLPTDRTDASGVKKPMKCTATNDTKTGKLLPKVLAKIVYPADEQPKLDGVRCFATNYEDGGFRFTSSSGKSYDVVCQHIKPELDALDLPVGIILDGELYEHGTPLEKISGWCRTTTRRIPEHDRMTFWIFDLPSNKVWKDRRIALENTCPIIMHPNSKIQFLMTWTVDSFEEAQRLHDEWVAFGYEGAIIRNHEGKYAYGVRSAEIFKMKNFQDAEFVIIGAELGKRGSFDMVFICKTKDDKTFKAKPNGDAELKEQYWADISNDLAKGTRNILGKKGTVRYLNLSSYGIPVGNTVLKCIRDYE